MVTDGYLRRLRHMRVQLANLTTTGGLALPCNAVRALKGDSPHACGETA